MAATAIWNRVRGFLPNPLAGGSTPAPATRGAAEAAQAQRALGSVKALLDGLAAEGSSLLPLVLNGNPFAPWRMYPWPGGVTDQRTASQYFYHAHEDYAGEHGHFHTFVYHRRKLVHLVAIGMDEKGWPNALYTFNRWGPGDTYFPAARLKNFLPSFRIEDVLQPDVRVGTFLNEMLKGFRAEIEGLFGRRDETFARYRLANGGVEPFEDRALEITSHLPINLNAQIRGLAAMAGGTAGTPAERRKPTAASRPAPVEPPQAGPLPLGQRATADLQAGLRAGENFGALVCGFEEGTSALTLVMGGQPLSHWRMYPWEGGAVDPRTRSHYFYHAHPNTPEHGHFHLFRKNRKGHTHLVALSLDDQGRPLELFTVNRWVTGEVVLPAAKTIGLVERFFLAGREPDPRLHLFLRYLLLLYRPEIEWLLRERDHRFADYRETHGGIEPYEDRALEVMSALQVDPEGHTQNIAAELRRRGVPVVS